MARAISQYTLGRIEAKLQGLRITGILGVLLAAKHHKKEDNIFGKGHKKTGESTFLKTALS